MSDHALTLGQRSFVWMWRRFSIAVAGFPDPFVEEHILNYGVREYMTWAMSAWDVIKMLQKRFGPIETQYIIAFAAMWTGCRWCGVGHLFSGNLELFKREGTLGPFDERRIPELQMMRDAEVLTEILESFSGPRWERMAHLAERQYLLISAQTEEEDRDDELLQAANMLWSWVMECSITAMDVDPLTIPPQTPIGKDRELIERYRQARAKQLAEPSG